MKSLQLNKDQMMWLRSIFDITERNEESEVTGANKSLLSQNQLLNRNDGSEGHNRRHSNLQASQTLRFSSISNNLLSLNNIDTELDGLGIV